MSLESHSVERLIQISDKVKKKKKKRLKLELLCEKNPSLIALRIHENASKCEQESMCGDSGCFWEQSSNDLSVPLKSTPSG